MVSSTLTIEAMNGLHVRPASIIVKKAKGYASDITITIDDKSASAKSLFKLQLLDLSKGKTMHIEVAGADEKEALEDLVQYITSVT